MFFLYWVTIIALLNSIMHFSSFTYNSDTVSWVRVRASDLQGKSWMLVCWWWWFDWSFARLIAPVVTTTSIILSSKPTDRLTQVYLEKWPLKRGGRYSYWSAIMSIYYTLPIIYILSYLLNVSVFQDISVVCSGIVTVSSEPPAAAGTLLCVDITGQRSW